MSSVELPIIILENPLIFMNATYLKTHILKDKYSNVEIIEISQNEVPIKIIIKLKEEALIDEFITQFNNKKYHDKLNYYLLLTKTKKSIEEIKKEEEKYKKLEEYKFCMDYENEWKNNYANIPEKSGLLYINEEGKNIGYRAVKYLIAKFTRNILESKSILNISLPVFMFDKRTLQMGWAHEQKLAPILLTKAAFSNDKIERLKWVTVYLMSFLHFSVIQIKPFNPIIGETFQCRIGTVDYYIEQTVNHPITLNIYGKEINGEFIIYGHLITDASVYLNSLYTSRLGKCYIKFKDGTLFRVIMPPITLKGLSLGDRLFNFIDKGLVLDLTNNLCSYITMNPEELGFFESFFKSKKSFPDYFRGNIVEIKDVTIDETGGNHILNKNAKIYGNIEGEWTSFISFDGVEYWNNNNMKTLKLFSHEFTLPSDGRFRPDLINLIEGNEDQSQIEKEKLEVRQRQDRKLRANYMNKKK
jgi:hypothetical protein